MLPNINIQLHLLKKNNFFGRQLHQKKDWLYPMSNSTVTSRQNTLGKISVTWDDGDVMWREGVVWTCPFVYLDEILSLWDVMWLCSVKQPSKLEYWKSLYCLNLQAFGGTIFQSSKTHKDAFLHYIQHARNYRCYWIPHLYNLNLKKYIECQKRRNLNFKRFSQLV